MNTLTLSHDRAGNYLLTDEHGCDQLYQVDWDFPSLAANFGYVPCDCGETDGTIACQHKQPGEMISDAMAWLDEHDGETCENNGEVVCEEVNA